MKYLIFEVQFGTVVCVCNSRIEATYLLGFLPKRFEYFISVLPKNTSEINHDFLKILFFEEYNEVMSSFDKKNQEKFNSGNPLFPGMG